jgi:hypothetical protein
MRTGLLLALSLLIYMETARAQVISVQPVYSNDSTLSIFSFKLHNTSADSIVVLHAQVFVEPPFINEYAEVVEQGATARTYRVQIGKSNNPRMPERYQAIRAIVPNDTLELFFRAPATAKDYKLAELYITLLDKKYLRDFQRMDQVPSRSDISRCKMLKEKYGKVKHFMVEF